MKLTSPVVAMGDAKHSGKPCENCNATLPQAVKQLFAHINTA